MNLSWQISFADLFDLIQPALFAAAALISAWVLADARRRSFRLYEVALWTLGALLLPHVMLPLYLLARMFRRRLEPLTGSAAEVESEGEAAPADRTDEAQAGRIAVATDTRAATSPEERLAEEEHAPSGESLPGDSSSLAVASSESFPRHRRMIPALYLLMALAPGALYFYHDYASMDAHLARANRALLRGQHERAINEYRGALRRADDPRTRELLGIQLAAMGRWEEALSEFLAAERAGEANAPLAFRIASALEALNRSAEARPFYQRFLDGAPCAAASPDPRCAQAQERARALGVGARP